ncbi:MAG: hypothetical protein IT282_11530 [Bacteroidetes bacterium]|nr:hypothetical protein [Bacteroidota bacterium]
MNTRSITSLFVIAVCLTPFLTARSSGQDEFSADTKTLVWHSPGLNSLGSVPLGNGDIGVNVWVERGGDVLFYVAKSDAWDENGRLVKLGRIRISLSPSPFADSQAYRQELNVGEGCVVISGGHGAGQATLRLWVDANNPVIVTEVESPLPLNARLTLELWRTQRRENMRPEEIESAYGLHGDGALPVVFESDSIVPHAADQLTWFHRNPRSVWKDNLTLQALDPEPLRLEDPLLHRTFGGLIWGENFSAISDTVLHTRDAQKKLHISILARTSLNTTSTDWTARIQKEQSIQSAISLALRRTAHRAWWKEFWERSSILVSSTDSAAAPATSAVTRGYMLQRFINACGGRGALPIKFNGSLFTVDTYDRKDKTGGFDADYRLWGGPYWFQNTRLPYWSMLHSGDFDMMKPLFAMYLNVLPLRKQAARNYYGHEGAFFPETMNFWGTYTQANYGWDRTGMPDGLTINRYIRYYWTAGLELSLMMLDYAEFQPRESFVRDTLLPVASNVLAFFDRHWPRDSAGIIRFEPAQALETYHTAVNPAPDVAGIRAVAERLLALPRHLTSDNQRKEWSRLLASLPPLPMRVVEGDTLLAPAREFETLANIENPELYAVFPFRLYGIGRPDLGLARRTYEHRLHKMNGGWQQHGVHAAYLGLAGEAARLVAENFARWDTLCRFPAFWGPNYDWTPDQDHGSVSMIALQRMLMQYEGDEILLLPAWPAEWDVDFRLHAPRNTVLQGTVRKGKVERLDVFPESRRKDIRVVGSPGSGR